MPVSRLRASLDRMESFLAAIGWSGVFAWLLGSSTVIVCATLLILRGSNLATTFLLTVPSLIGTFYFPLVPLAYRALVREYNVAQERRADPDVWRQCQHLRIFEAACLLADIEPAAAMVRQPGAARDWYQILINSIVSKEIRIPLEMNDANAMHQPNEHTIVNKRALQIFAHERGITTAALA